MRAVGQPIGRDRIYKLLSAVDRKKQKLHTDSAKETNINLMSEH